MVGIYFSGTGNTEHCVEKLLHLLDENAKAIPMEAPEAEEAVKNNDFIILGYSVQFSNAPIMVRDFIHKHRRLWNGKKVLCVATMGLFSGDGTGCAARILKKYGAEVVGGLHLRMPDSISDEKALKNSLEKNREIIRKSDTKIEQAAASIQQGNYPKEGLGFFYHMAGLFGQRLWFYAKTQKYSNKLKINDSCVGCGACAKACPMQNIKMEQGKPIPQNQCTMCYRCVSQCPKQAITLLGNKVHKQYRYEKMGHLG